MTFANIFHFEEIQSLYGSVLGTDSGDRLTGNSFFNKISGLGDNDTIMGGGLFDILRGGDGNDTVSYANAKSGVTVDLRITGTQWTGGSLFDKISGFENITGSNFNDTLIGDSGQNRLSGGLGKDKMIGGLGNDIYSVDNAGDMVIELDGEGIDIVLSSINYKLPNYIENLSLFGTATLATGNSLDNVMAGNAMDNIIRGGGGRDSVVGGAGADTFIYEFATNGNSTKVNDFASGEDKLALKGSVFGLSAGSLPADWLVISATGGVTPDGTHNLGTTSAHGQFIFDRYNNLFWDADGSGDGKAVLIGSTGGSTITLDDFIVI